MADEYRNGVLLVDKEPGGTSHDVVQQARRLLREKKIGHCGTLDPGATGLLVLTVGQATRLTRFLIRAPKVYEGTLRLGVVTDTYDADGEVTAEHPVAGVTEEAIREAMATFEGTYDQQPPPYSAKKVKGVRYYELARRGEEVPQETKPVEVFEFTARGPLTGDRLDFRLACSSGTYARSLVHDLGTALGCGAHLVALRRLAVGPFQVETALELGEIDRLLAAGEELDPAWVPFDGIPLPFGEVTADSQQERRIHHGQTVLMRDLAGDEGDWVKLVNRRRELIAVGTISERIGSAGVGIIQPRVVFK